MSNQSEKPDDSTATIGSISSGVLSHRDKAMTALNLLISLLDETTGFLKLYLGLATGAIVLFVKVLTDAHFPTVVLSALAISIFCFGFSALTCLELILGVISFRGNMVVTMTSADPNWQQVFDSRLRNWRKGMQKAGTRMEWSFRLAIIFASIFVVGVLVKR